MIFNEFRGKTLPRLGFGMMRLPQKDGGIDQEQVEAMVDYAMAHGVNYFDTAFPYHEGKSELSTAKALKKYPRESYYLADKYPGHQIAESYNPAEIFEEQLEKCGVDYFDFYLLHNVYENSFRTYSDPRWGIVDYFVEQKKLGRIKHLGFSFHSDVKLLKEFLDRFGEHMEFAQIQLNYLDWTLQDAKGKYELLTERKLPVWVMEPLRGGKLAALPEEQLMKLKAVRPEDSAASWGLSWLMGLPNVKMVLSGMSAFEQMTDNIRTMDNYRPLSAEEEALLFDIAETLKDSVPCTSCRYCTSGCPMELNIPKLIGLYNEIKLAGSINIVMQLEYLDEDKRPAACIGCGACAAVCPQHIDIPEVLRALDEKASKLPSWVELSRQRNEAAEKLRAEKAAKQQ